MKIKSLKIGLDKLYKDKDWKHFKGKMVVPLGAQTETHNLIGKFENGFSLFVGGRTDYGKSNFMNCMMVNLLKNVKQDDLKFILIDPKRTDFLAYSEIPNLALPIIIDVDEAESALGWCIKESIRRLELFKEKNFLCFDHYNDESDEKLSRILVVINEFSCLLLSDPETWEDIIMGLAENSHITGINIIIGTSNFSAENIHFKKIIKAFHSKVALNTFTKKDSKALVGCAGAEKLKSNEDMFVLFPDMKKAVHLRGFHVDKKEINDAVKFVNKNLKT